jgi:hypothetical protein
MSAPPGTRPPGVQYPLRIEKLRHSPHSPYSGSRFLVSTLTISLGSAPRFPAKAVVGHIRPPQFAHTRGALSSASIAPTPPPDPDLAAPETSLSPSPSPPARFHRGRFRHARRLRTPGFSTETQSSHAWTRDPAPAHHGCLPPFTRATPRASWSFRNLPGSRRDPRSALTVSAAVALAPRGPPGPPYPAGERADPLIQLAPGSTHSASVNAFPRPCDAPRAPVPTPHAEHVGASPRSATSRPAARSPGCEPAGDEQREPAYLRPEALNSRRPKIAR